MSLKSGLRAWLGASAVALAMATGASTGHAAEVYNKNGMLLNFNAEIQAFAATSSEDFDGDLLNDRGRVSWTEGLVKLGFSTEIDITRGWKVFGTVTGIANGTGGEGDAGGYAAGGDGEVDLYDAFGGIKFGEPGKGPSFKLSAGQQSVRIADAFLIGADVPTLGSAPTFTPAPGVYDEGGAYYLNARKAFEETVVLNVDTGTPLRFDAFYLKSGKKVQGDTAVAGGNVELTDEKWGKVGFMYTRIMDADIAPFNFGNRQEDTNMYSIHGSSSLGITDFLLAANYTWQERDESATTPEVDAYGYYISGTYKFSKVKYTPELMYRYSSFSGDDLGTTDKLEGFDPLFFGSIGWGTWFQGEIAANYTGPFNSNVDVHQVKLVANITDTVNLGGYVSTFNLREATASTNKDDFGVELDLFAEFTINKNLYISPLYGVMFHGDALNETWAKDEDATHYFQLLAIYTY